MFLFFSLINTLKQITVPQSQNILYRYSCQPLYKSKPLKNNEHNKCPLASSNIILAKSHFSRNGLIVKLTIFKHLFFLYILL